MLGCLCVQRRESMDAKEEENAAKQALAALENLRT